MRGTLPGVVPDAVLRFSGRSHHERAQALEALVTELPDTAHELRAQAYGSLASACAADVDRAAAAATLAGESAQRAQTEAARVWAGFATCVSNLAPEHAAMRAEQAAEILAAEPTESTQQLVPLAYFLLLGALTELGRVSELDRALDPGGEILRRHPALDESRYAAWFRCVRATLDGRTEAAEQLTMLGLERAEQVGDPDGVSVQLGQLAVLRWMQGRAGELEPMLLQARQLLPDDVIWSATLAWVWLSQGRVSAARGLVSMLPPLATVPRDRNWLAALSILGVVAAQLEDRTRAAEILELLGEFSDRLASIGMGVTVWGTVARPLARIHLMRGEISSAIERYRDAIRVCTVAGAQAWLAEAQLELAELLLTSEGALHASEPGGAQREAEALLAEARATAHVLHLRDIEQACTALAARLRNGSEASVQPVVPSRAESAPVVRVMGTFEVIALDGEIAHWQSRKARELLKILVANRGAPVRKELMMDLLWPGVHPEQLGNRLAVALMTVRRALDPQQREHRSAFLGVTRQSIRLCLNRCAVDVEEWFAAVDAGLAASGPERVHLLGEVLEQARQPVCTDEPDEGWAENLRRGVRSRAFAAAYALVDESLANSDPLRAADAYHWILSVDPYDQRAHLGLIDTFTAMGAHGHASSARDEYERRMGELGLDAAV